MTYLEKVLSENPQMEPCEVMEEKCPSDFGYEDSKCADCSFSLELDECTQCWNREMPEVVDVSMLVEKYNEGLNDAWELAKKIADITLTSERAKIFGYVVDGIIVTDILRDFTPQEAMERMKVYEDSKIEVGDVVNFKENVFVVIRKDFDSVLGIDHNGETWETVIEECKKTGKHIDIKCILEQIGE